VDEKDKGLVSTRMWELRKQYPLMKDPLGRGDTYRKSVPVGDQEKGTGADS